MRVLGIETSSRRGSVALAEDDRVVARASPTELNAHAEQLGPLLERVLSEAGWDKQTLERVAVGVGPGSFTGLRVGIAFAQGIALGLGIPLVGLGSLRVMSAACPLPGVRVPLLDARRGEVFAAAYDAAGEEQLAPVALARESALTTLAERLGREVVLLGEVVAELRPGASAAVHRSEGTDLPDAGALALQAVGPAGSTPFVEPLYVRDAGATPQALVPSPFRRD